MVMLRRQGEPVWGESELMVNGRGRSLGDAVGHEGQGVVEGPDALFEVEDADVEQVHLRLLETGDGVDQRVFQVFHEVSQFIGHTGGIPRRDEPDRPEGEP